MRRSVDQLSIFGGPALDRRWRDVADVNPTLEARHYLGAVHAGFAWQDEHGIMVFANPRSRRMPMHWLELVRWCITSTEPNAGSRQWSAALGGLRRRFGDCTTLVSYSDPSAGHTGGLYRACSWWWAPTWHRLRPPPSGNGAWTEGEEQSVKDRWVFALRPDRGRVERLTLTDDAILRRMPEARYREPGGVPLSILRSLRTDA